MALNNSYNLIVRVQSGNDYVGEGEFEVTIVDDDRKLNICGPWSTVI